MSQNPEGRDSRGNLPGTRGFSARTAPAPEPNSPAAPALASAAVPVDESVGLARAMRACPHRSTEGCGCSGGRCALRGGANVSHRDCFDCLRSDPT